MIMKFIYVTDWAIQTAIIKCEVTLRKDDSIQCVTPDNVQLTVPMTSEGQTWHLTDVSARRRFQALRKGHCLIHVNTVLATCTIDWAARDELDKLLKVLDLPETIITEPKDKQP